MKQSHRVDAVAHPTHGRHPCNEGRYGCDEGWIGGVGCAPVPSA